MEEVFTGESQELRSTAVPLTPEACASSAAVLLASAKESPKDFHPRRIVWRIFPLCADTHGGKSGTLYLALSFFRPLDFGLVVENFCFAHFDYSFTPSS
jgi:hypothetical protein